MATKAEMLAEAKTALHILLMGEKPQVVVDQNGERVEYNRTSITQLKSYIAQLESEISGKPSGPMRAIF